MHICTLFLVRDRECGTELKEALTAHICNGNALNGTVLLSNGNGIVKAVVSRYVFVLENVLIPFCLI